MTTETEPTPGEPTDPQTPTDPAPPPDPETPADPPPPPDPEAPTDPEPNEPPPAPELPGGPLTFEPATWYEVEVVCLTQDKGNGQPCLNLNVVMTEPMVYSNAGQPLSTCGPCGKLRTILSGVKLDPQPEMS